MKKSSYDLSELVARTIFGQNEVTISSMLLYRFYVLSNDYLIQVHRGCRHTGIFLIAMGKNYPRN